MSSAPSPARPFLLHLLFLTLLFAALSSPRFSAFDKSCVVPLTVSLPRLSSLHPSPGLAAWGCRSRCGNATGAGGQLPGNGTFLPSLPRASSLAVKRVEKRKRKLVTPEYAQR